MRKDKSRGRNDMWRETPHHATFFECVPDEMELVVFEVA
jgi:hypothetical protein